MIGAEPWRMHLNSVKRDTYQAARSRWATVDEARAASLITYNCFHQCLRQMVTEIVRSAFGAKPVLGRDALRGRGLEPK